MLAMAQDTVGAAVRTATVAVITSDPVVAAAMSALGATVVPEPRNAGLNAAVIHATVLLRANRIAAIPADLPALDPAELADALAAAALNGHGEAVRAAVVAPHGAYVPDAAGTGTVLLASSPGGRLVPRFGPASARAHARDGAYRLTGDWPTLRRDVDTGADLAAAATLGLGRHTAALIGRRGAALG